MCIFETKNIVWKKKNKIRTVELFFFFFIIFSFELEINRFSLVVLGTDFFFSVFPQTMWSRFGVFFPRDSTHHTLTYKLIELIHQRRRQREENYEWFLIITIDNHFATKVTHEKHIRFCHVRKFKYKISILFLALIEFDFLDFILYFSCGERFSTHANDSVHVFDWKLFSVHFGFS